LQNMKKEDYENLPDLFVIDWWKWQLNVLKSIYDENKDFAKILERVDFVSIWKWSSRKRWNKISWEKEKVYKFDTNFEIIEMEMDYDEADKILVKIRDESHRFANKYRKKQESLDFFKNVK